MQKAIQLPYFRMVHTMQLPKADCEEFCQALSIRRNDQSNIDGLVYSIHSLVMTCGTIKAGCQLLQQDAPGQNRQLPMPPPLARYLQHRRPSTMRPFTRRMLEGSHKTTHYMVSSRLLLEASSMQQASDADTDHASGWSSRGILLIMLIFTTVDHTGLCGKADAHCAADEPQ